MRLMEEVGGRRRYAMSGMFPLVQPQASPHQPLEIFDSVTDMDGKGATLVYHECACCGCAIWRGMMALVPVYCQECSSAPMPLLMGQGDL